MLENVGARLKIIFEYLLNVRVYFFVWRAFCDFLLIWTILGLYIFVRVGFLLRCLFEKIRFSFLIYHLSILLILFLLSLTFNQLLLYPLFSLNFDSLCNLTLHFMLLLGWYITLNYIEIILSELCHAPHIVSLRTGKLCHISLRLRLVLSDGRLRLKSNLFFAHGRFKTCSSKEPLLLGLIDIFLNFWKMNLYIFIFVRNFI